VHPQEAKLAFLSRPLSAAPQVYHVVSGRRRLTSKFAVDAVLVLETAGSCGIAQ